jgi:hypothetical protein
MKRCSSGARTFAGRDMPHRPKSRGKLIVLFHVGKIVSGGGSLNSVFGAALACPLVAGRPIHLAALPSRRSVPKRNAARKVS